jgi:hypothetical protein
MGDYYETIVDVEASEADAEPLAKRVVDDLCAREVLQPTRTDCALGALAYPPGQNARKALKHPSSFPLVQTLVTNGMEVVLGRTVHYSWLEAVRCPACGFELREHNAEQHRAIEEWRHGNGEGLVRCPGCGAVESITRWVHDPPWGFADLGFQFWNWGPLNRPFGLDRRGVREMKREVMIEARRQPPEI